MTASPDVAFRIDADDRITTVNDGWISFAEANGGEHLRPPEILGASLWSAIDDSATRSVYRSLLSWVRKGRQPVRFQFRCDGPDERRLLRMEVTATEHDEVDFRASLVRSEPRAEVALMRPAPDRSGGLVTMCGWCMRIPVDGVWVEIEEAIQKLGLLETSPTPQLSHGMCPACYATMIAALDDPELAASGDVTLGALPHA